MISQEIYSLAPTEFNVFKAGEPDPKKLKRIVYGQATSGVNGVATLYVSGVQVDFMVLGSFKS